MVRTVSKRDAEKNIGNLLESVRLTKEPVVVEEGGEPYAVVISREDYERIIATREQAWEAIDRIRELNTDEDPDEVLEFVTSVVEEVRQERYDERIKADQRGR